MATDPLARLAAYLHTQGMLAPMPTPHAVVDVAIDALERARQATQHVARCDGDTEAVAQQDDVMQAVLSWWGSQAAVAVHLGVAPSTVSRWVTHTRRMSAPMRATVTALLHAEQATRQRYEDQWRQEGVLR